MLAQSLFDDRVRCLLVDRQGDVRVPEVVNTNLFHRGITFADAFVAHADRALATPYPRRLEHRRIFTQSRAQSCLRSSCCRSRHCRSKAIMPWLRLMRQMLALGFGGVMIFTPPRRNTDLLTVSSLRLKLRSDQSNAQSSPTCIGSVVHLRQYRYCYTSMRRSLIRRHPNIMEIAMIAKTA